MMIMTMMMRIEPWIISRIFRQIPFHELDCYTYWYPHAISVVFSSFKMEIGDGISAYELKVKLPFSNEFHLFWSGFLCFCCFPRSIPLCKRFHAQMRILWKHQSYQCMKSIVRLNSQPISKCQYQFPFYYSNGNSPTSNCFIRSKHETLCTIISFIRRNFNSHNIGKSSNRKYDWYAVKTNSCTNYFSTNKR